MDIKDIKTQLNFWNHQVKLYTMDLQDVEISLQAAKEKVHDLESELNDALLMDFLDKNGYLYKRISISNQNPYKYDYVKISKSEFNPKPGDVYITGEGLNIEDDI